jgi:cobalt-zinc-cadmium efflux system outer membrane protein
MTAPGRKHGVRARRCAALLALAGCATPPPYNPPPLPALQRPDILLDVQPPDPQTAAAWEAFSCRGGADVPVPPPVGPSAPLPAVVTLPQAIQETIFSNLRVRAGTENIQQARADLLSDSLIPNPQLLYDSLLNPWPGGKFTPDRQGGPPQMDVVLTYPIDWYLFGKRVAAMQASRLGVDVAAADFADLVRQRVADTVGAFYELLEAREQLDLAKEDLAELQKIEGIIKQRVALGGAGSIELERIRLAVIDAQREARRRELVLETSKSKMRPLLGRMSIDPDFDIKGSLDIAQPLAAPDLEQALQVAGRQRPDLISLTRQVAQAEAAIHREQTKAYPQVTVAPGATYQFQKTTIGFPDARSVGVTVTTTLPVTDRNQGNIDKARSQLRQNYLTLQAQLAEVRAEVEQAVETYRVALVTVTTDDPETLEAAKKMRDRIVGALGVGGVRLLDLLDAERAYRDRKRLSITGKADYWRALYRLNASVGSRLLE